MHNDVAQQYECVPEAEKIANSKKVEWNQVNIDKYVHPLPELHLLQRIICIGKPVMRQRNAHLWCI
jgi:hypothetical protein